MDIDFPHYSFELLAQTNLPAIGSPIVTTEAKEGLLTRSMTLYAFCEEHEVTKIDFLKADIEGGELSLFEGGRTSLTRFRPTILFESMHTGPLFPVRTILKDIGYTLHCLDDTESDIFRIMKTFMEI